jgi:hypothetical protein
MKKIFEKIYTEKDSITNLAIFIASLFTVLIYLFTKELYLSALFFLAFFSFTKVISGFFIGKIYKTSEVKEDFSRYSSREMHIIFSFVENGSLFLSYSILKERRIGLDDIGLDSLVSRGVVKESRGGLYFEKGLILDENIYKLFLNYRNK